MTIAYAFGPPGQGCKCPRCLEPLPAVVNPGPVENARRQAAYEASRRTRVVVDPDPRCDTNPHAKTTP